MAFYVGIDYSINSPAVCIAPVNFKGPRDCYFFYRRLRKKNIDPTGPKFCGFPTPDWNSSAERFYANWILVKKAFETTNHHIAKIQRIYIEGYSYGSRGAIFDLAENVGFLRSGLWEYKYEAIPVAPPTIKKWATGNGRAEKTEMYEAWLKEGGFDLAKYWDQKSDSNPISDIVDSYFVMKTGVEKKL